MSWLNKAIQMKVRKKQKKVARQFVDDATEKLKENVQKSTYDYISLGLSTIQIVAVIAEVVTSIGTGNVPEVLTTDIPTVINNYGTINIGGK